MNSKPLDPRVGMLMRNGRPVYYACVAGQLQERATPDAVVAMLEGAEIFAAKPAKPARSVAYVVSVSLKYPSWDSVPSTLTIDAANQKDAISKERELMRRNCIFSREDGPLSYAASRA